jgi:hypothetical protein
MEQIMKARMLASVSVMLALGGLSACTTPPMEKAAPPAPVASPPAAEKAPVVAGPPTTVAATGGAGAMTSATGQTVYASAEQAVQALYLAVKRHDLKQVYAVLGPGSDTLIYTGDAVADRQMRENFLAAADSLLKIERQGDAQATLLLGTQEHPFPFPLVKGSQGWTFDAEAGAEEIVNRRIGENELFAIRFCLAYGDAQQEYAEADRDGDGLVEYAQKFRSSEGQRDGLFWPAKDGEPLSPLGPLAAQAKAEGYSAQEGGPVPYHGYFYRILAGQGPDAVSGAYDYVVNGNMIGGYALLAYPARWGASGVMAFVCNHDGVVYQKDLGEQTAAIAAATTLYNPDASWQKAE